MKNNKRIPYLQREEEAYFSFLKRKDGPHRCLLVLVKKEHTAAQ